MPQCSRLVPLCTILALILSASLLLAACNGGDAPTRQPGSTQSEERVPPTPRGTPQLATTSPETDRATLVALYDSTDGPNWRYSDNWLSDAPLGEWHGVTTNYHGRVIDLELNRNQLSGEIPPELGNLANLTVLNLGFNQLSGEIPPELGSLANLIGLTLHANQLSGCVPNRLLRRLSSESDLGGLPSC